MIPYYKSFLGLNLIFRLNGSPIYRAAVPGIISSIFFCLIRQYINDHGSISSKYVGHPYGLGVLISSVSFLIIFRLNNAYQRYWGACGDVYQMMSKWLDAVTHTATYHLQQDHYNHIKPPSYYDHHDLNMYGFRRDREREKDFARVREPERKEFRISRTVSRSIEQISESKANYKSWTSSLRNLSSDDESISDQVNSSRRNSSSQTVNIDPHLEAIRDPFYLLDEGKKDGGWGDLFDDGKSTFYDRKEPASWDMKLDMGFASEVGGRTHVLFLQELIHLASLCNAVAFSTLRCDIEGSPAPLGLYKPGSSWPEVDPDNIKYDNDNILSSFVRSLNYLTGMDKSDKERTKQNAKRPIPVIGGISDNEIAFLQRARGASAKVNLVWNWLSEFIIREHLAGSLGAVGPPIISRIFQFLSDGMIYYNHCRKTSFIPFPYPHAQISAFFVFFTMFAVPLLMDEYAEDTYLGALLTFLTVVCLAGAHEVARELENPFRNLPNEIPLITLQAQFNEALITLYSGYHPDHFWDANEYRRVGKNDFKKTNAGARERMIHWNVVTDNVVRTPESVPSDFEELKNLVLKQQEEIQNLTVLLDGKEQIERKTKLK
jgi:predicted membrane chloride channel (bestrophin family)